MVAEAEYPSETEHGDGVGECGVGKINLEIVVVGTVGVVEGDAPGGFVEGGGEAGEIGVGVGGGGDLCGDLFDDAFGGGVAAFNVDGKGIIIDCELEGVGAVLGGNIVP